MGHESRSKYAILGILAQGPCSGYGIKNKIEEEISHFWHESYGQIYPTLKQLHSDGLVIKAIERQEKRPNRHIYTITDAGYEALLEWLRQPVELQPDRIEILLKLFFGRNLTMKENIQHLETHKQRMTAANYYFQQVVENLQAYLPEDPDLAYQLIALDYGIHTTEAIMRWCDKTIQTMKNPEMEPD